LSANIRRGPIVAPTIVEDVGMDEATVDELLTPRGRGLLEALPPYDEAAALRLGEALREGGYSPALVSAALTQSRLRARAHAKLGEFADGMIFTADGLEQATRLELAARHGQRFRASGVRHVLDLGCGIGADAMALASLDLGVTAVEADPVTAAVARYNLRHFPGVDVLVARAEEVPITGLAGRVGAWLDPARRTPGRTDAQGRTRRVFSLDALSPSWDFVCSVAEAIPATGAKLSPSFPHARIPAGTEAAWTSYGGEVLECAIWWGPLVRQAGRTATIVNRDGGPDVVVTQSDADGLGPVASGLPDPGGYLYEPDRAVLQAGLVGALTRAVDGVELSHGVGYVVSDVEADVPFARRFRVCESMPLSVKALRPWLREHGIGRLTIKKRGVQVDADVLRRQLRLDGRGEEVTVVLTRAGTASAFLVVEPA
jgi:SAM-dependent methyltransferase